MNTAANGEQAEQRERTAPDELLGAPAELLESGCSIAPAPSAAEVVSIQEGDGGYPRSAAAAAERDGGE
jgi:hypothetical protein